MLPRPWIPPPPADPQHIPLNMLSSAEETTRTGGLMNKPVRGWLHSDQKIMDSGICYAVRYIGCLEVNTSMKSLDFDTRSFVAKECINRLCEAARLKTVDKKRKVDKRLSRMLADKPNMDYAGSNVNLTITSSYLHLVSMETGEVIANHEMPNISFASGGDADTLDFVSYVAKDQRYGRACFVLECGGGLAQDVIITIGQAFELRYKRFLKQTPSVSSGEQEIAGAQASHNGNIQTREDPDYYNDLPGKVPPDVNDLDLLSAASSSNGFQNDLGAVAKVDINHNPQPVAIPPPPSSTKHDMSDSLIDFAADVPNISTHHKPEPEYVNTTAVIFNERLTAKSKSEATDIFDMQPLSCSLASVSSEEPPSGASATAFHPIGSSLLCSSNAASRNLSSVLEKVRASLLSEPWYHGPISRKNSESLVVRDGEFLVRESQGSPGQYVLTGMQNGQRKHLLLVDPEGVIRTKDQVFESIGHLIRYHMDNSLPIVSAESALLLRTPVCKVMPIGKSVQV